MDKNQEKENPPSLFENIEIVTKTELPENCLFKYKKDNIIRDGDMIIFWDDKDNFHQT